MGQKTHVRLLCCSLPTAPMLEFHYNLQPNRIRCRDHRKYWRSLTGLRQAKGFIQGPSAKRAKELLNLERNQLRWVVGLLTGHCHLNGHLFKLGLSNSPTCDRCQKENETATHILCECEALAHLRFRRLGRYFMEPSDYFDVPTYKILHYIRSAGLLRG
jgi:hypothetical protein